jgi:hypothetical protein
VTRNNHFTQKISRFLLFPKIPGTLPHSSCMTISTINIPHRNTTKEILTPKTHKNSLIKYYVSILLIAVTTIINEKEPIRN